VGGVSTKKPFVAAQQWAFFMHPSLDSTASEPRLAPLISEGGVSTKKPFVAAQQWDFFMHLSLDSTASEPRLAPLISVGESQPKSLLLLRNNGLFLCTSLLIRLRPNRD
jgi:hypothetical protein